MLNRFFANHKIFTFKEIESYWLSAKAFPPVEAKQPNVSTLRNMLGYHQKKGHILHIRRGLYYVISKGSSSDECAIDPFLVASKMADNAILGYRTALDFFGKLHTLSSEFIYLSKRKEPKPFIFNEIAYRGVSIPRALERKGQVYFEVAKENRSDHPILVTSLERTFVDVLDRPHLCGSWEEIWRSLESIEYLNFDKVLHYTQLLENATTVARVGFILDTHREQWMIPDTYLSELKKIIPRQPQFLDRSLKRKQQLITDWNLIVPLEIINREWEEPHEDI